LKNKSLYANHSKIHDINIEGIISDINNLASKINGKKINIMEVCGTHTMAIAKNGLRQLLPSNINLISGPGCPVCVTPVSDIDWILGIINNYKITVFTFGDMIRVPGSRSSLILEKSLGKDITICYSPSDALDFAENNPDKNVIFIAIGFETTIPLSAVIIKRAAEKNLKNFFIFCTHKIIPPALDLLLQDKNIQIDGLLLPGHVSAIIGMKPYEFIPQKYDTPCVISGFEPIDILSSINMILKQIENLNSKVEIEYKRVVKKEGNPFAVQEIYDVFEPEDSKWRGLGDIAGSGLKIKDKYSKIDSKIKFHVDKIDSKESAGCECGNILKGIKNPFECKYFAKSCTPGSPIGPCMVSSEGTCAAYFKYERY
jgi:hydrogenase expression/formation protein HypD